MIRRTLTLAAVSGAALTGFALMSGAAHAGTEVEDNINVSDNHTNVIDNHHGNVSDSDGVTVVVSDVLTNADILQNVNVLNGVLSDVN